MLNTAQLKLKSFCSTSEKRQIGSKTELIASAIELFRIFTATIHVLTKMIWAVANWRIDHRIESLKTLWKTWESEHWSTSSVDDWTKDTIVQIPKAKWNASNFWCVLLCFILWESHQFEIKSGIYTYICTQHSKKYTRTLHSLCLFCKW